MTINNLRSLSETSTNQIVEEENMKVSKGVEFFTIHPIPTATLLFRNQSENQIRPTINLQEKNIYLQKIQVSCEEKNVTRPVLQLSASTLKHVDNFLQKKQRHYTPLSLSSLKTVSDIYYLHLINQKTDIKEEVYLYLPQDIQDLMSSRNNPLIKSILLNLRHYHNKVNENSEKLETANDSIKKIHAIISSLLVGNILTTNSPRLSSYAEFFINVIDSLDTRSKMLLSYILFADQINKLNDLKVLIKECALISVEKIITFRENLSSQKPSQFIPPENYQFTGETIIRSFIPEKVLLPECLLINFEPINLNQFTASQEDNFFNFFRLLFDKTYLSHNHDRERQENILQVFHTDQQLPDDLKNLWGISTISARLLAFNHLLKIYPLKTNKIDVRFNKEKGLAQVFYTINIQEISYTQPLNIVIYPKKDPKNPDCFAIDELRPLANVSFLWTSYIKNETYSHSMLQFQSLEFTVLNDKMIATSKEKRFIKEALRLKKINISNKLKNKINIFLSN